MTALQLACVVAVGGAWGLPMNILLSVCYVTLRLVLLCLAHTMQRPLVLLAASAWYVAVSARSVLLAGHVRAYSDLAC